MKVTVVTLEDDRLMEHFVGVIEGVIDDATRQQIAKGLNALLWREIPATEREGCEIPGQFKEDARWLWFREVETTADPMRVRLLNIDDMAGIIPTPK
jgi:hypothetical protein